MPKRVQFSLFAALLALMMASLFAACGTSSSTTTSTASPTKTTSTATSTASPTKTNGSASTVLLKVIGVDISLSVPSIRNTTCGTNITESYNAVFHFPANTSGGTVTFQTTTNNGRSSQPASLTVRPQQTSATYTFSQSGQANSDNVFPGRGGVQVTAPNTYTSDMVAPLGPCRSTTATSPFQVTRIGLVAGPEVTGHRCETQFTEQYTATFHIVPSGPGVTIMFQYTTDNGRSSSANVSLPVAASQTTVTYTFQWSGTLPQSHTAPGIGIVMMSAPSQMSSPSATPPGGCNNM